MPLHASVALEVRLFDRLFDVPNPAAADDFRQHLNPDSLRVLTAARGEPALATASATTFQFERLGYFCRDSRDASATRAVFNRTVTLRDTWSRIKNTTPA